MAVNYCPGHYEGMGYFKPGNHGEWREGRQRTGQTILLGPRWWDVVLDSDGSGNLYKRWLTGVHAMVHWVDLEPGLSDPATVNTPGDYSTGIALIRRTLEELEKHGLKLSLQIQFSGWSTDLPMPKYMNKAAYGQMGRISDAATGYGSHYLSGDANGTAMMPRFWRDDVATRAVLLLEALGNAFNGDSRLAAICLPEFHPVQAAADTAGLTTPNTDGPARVAAFLRNWLRILTAASEKFNEHVVTLNATFAPTLWKNSAGANQQISNTDLRNFLKSAIDLNIGFSGPDTVPAKAAGNYDTAWEAHHTKVIPEILASIEANDEPYKTRGYNFPRSIQHQQQSSFVSTSFFGLERNENARFKPSNGAFTEAVVGAAAKRAGDSARATPGGATSAAVLTALGSEGTLRYAVDKLKCGMVIWTAGTDSLTPLVTGPNTKPKYWNDKVAMQTLKRLTPSGANQMPPIFTEVPYTVSIRGGGVGQGQYITPPTFVVEADEVAWTWTRTENDLKHFEIETSSGRKIKVGKAMRSIPISALGASSGGTVSIKAVKTDGEKSPAKTLTFQATTLDPPNEVCVNATDISWAFDSDETRPTGFNVYLSGGTYNNTLIAARGPASTVASAPLPSGLVSGTTYTASVRTVTQTGLSAAKSKAFTHPVVGNPICSEEPVDPGCTDITTKTATCPIPLILSGTAIHDLYNKQHNDLVTALTGATIYDIVFLGDSITRGWTLTKNEDSKPYVFNLGSSVWNKTDDGLSFPQRACNAGISSDNIQGLLWRIKGGYATNTARTTWAFDNAKRYFKNKHKIAVLLIGTNNLGATKFITDPADKTNDTLGVNNIVAGIEAIVNEIKSQSEQATKVLILGILPREADPPDRRARNVNAALVAKYASTPDSVRVMDLRLTFATSTSGWSQRTSLYGSGSGDSSNAGEDRLHINRNGYAAIRTAILPVLKSWLGITA